VTNSFVEPVPDQAEAARENTESGSTAAQMADEVFERGVALGATDIHIEPTTDAVEVRYRLDGILRRGPSFPKSMQGPLVTRIKVLAGLNIAESRLPQDGRLRITASKREIDLRVSTFPTIYGEDLVLRILDRARVPLRLSGLGFTESDLGLLREVLARPLGLVLLTGPTGSGKTTTLYSALAELNTGERCILTIEDPVEYEVEGIRQSQINPRAGLTFASGLRSMLRHDPDVILVGEIRDLDTAQIALSAAMTGHMVLSTIHTNSAAAAIPRLLDMGTEPFALASSLQLTVAQRLVRALCPECRQPTDVPPAVRRRFSLEDVQLYRAVGCARCGQTGYRGRGAIFEFLPVSEAVAAAIYDRRGAEEIQRLGGRPTLLDAGLEKVRNGSTTLEELLRVVSL
jgi:general secretion pathway protein E